MSSPVRSKACSVGAAERRQQHREVERQALVRAVEGLVEELALLDPLDVGAEDRADAALTEQRLGPGLAGGQEAALAEDHAADAEVAELVLVGQVDDLGQVAHPGRAELVLDVEGVLECCSLAGAGAVAHADDQPLRLAGAEPVDDLVERGRGLDGVTGGADRPGVAVRSEAGCGLEVELGAGRVDQVVVADQLVSHPTAPGRCARRPPLAEGPRRRPRATSATAFAWAKVIFWRR